MSFQFNDRKFDGQSFKGLAKSARVLDSRARSLGRDGVIFRDAPMTGTGYFLEQQLTYIVPEILKMEMPNRPMLDILEADNSGAYDKMIIQRMGVFEGRHQPKNPGALKDSTITVDTKMNAMLVVDFQGSSTYDYISLNKSKQLNENIDTRIIEAHNESYRTIVDEVALLGYAGDQTSNAYVAGLANSPLVPADNTLTAGHDWKSPATTGNDIVDDLLALRNRIYAVGGGNALWMPNTVLVSPEDFIILNGKNFSVTGFTTSETAMSYCTRQYGMKFYASQHLRGAGVGSKDRVVMFNNDRKALRLMLPLPLTFSAVEPQAFDFRISSMFRVAGVNLFQPSTVGYMDNI